MCEVLDYESREPKQKVWPVVLLSLGTLVAMIVLAMAMAEYGVRPRPPRWSSRPSVMSNLKIALGVFETDTGRYPTTAEGIEALLVCPAGLNGTWRGPYVRRVPLDGWGHPLFYCYPGATDPASYDLISAGADGVLGTADDIGKDDIY
jgi:general secretion pathway protein G